jgi:acyl phosphate:glycerol-3-phosphate acyltransferase
MVSAALFIAAAFLAGSIPFGVLVGRVFFHSDIRATGSGNIGAANALRTYGRGGGAAVLALDALKGFAPVWAVFALTPPGGAQVTLAAATAFAAVLGHCFSPWLAFKGGKGVATWLGALFALSWPLGLGFMLVWLVAVLPTRYSSLGSLCATVLSAACVGFVTGSLQAGLWSAAAALLIVYKHRENIVRLAQGRERKLREDSAGAGPKERRT